MPPIDAHAIVTIASFVCLERTGCPREAASSFTGAMGEAHSRWKV